MLWWQGAQNILSIRPRRSRSAAAYSRQSFPWTIFRSVGMSVCLSSALWQNGGSDPDVVWHHRSDGSRDEAGSGIVDRSTGRGTFGGEFGAPIVSNGDCTKWGLYGVRVRQCRDAALFPNYFGQTCYLFKTLRVHTILIMRRHERSCSWACCYCNM